MNRIFSCELDFDENENIFKWEKYSIIFSKDYMVSFKAFRTWFAWIRDCFCFSFSLKVLEKTTRKLNMWWPPNVFAIRSSGASSLWNVRDVSFSMLSHMWNEWLQMVQVLFFTIYKNLKVSTYCILRLVSSCLKELLPWHE